MKTVPDLILDLEEYTKTLLLTIQDSIESEFLEENRSMFALSEEKLRISQTSGLPVKYRYKSFSFFN